MSVFDFPEPGSIFDLSSSEETPKSVNPDDVTPPRDEESDESSELDTSGISAELAERENIEQPAKVIRIGAMIKKLLEEVRSAPLDEASRIRMKEIYETSTKELSEGLSPDLRAELDRLTLAFDSDDDHVPTESELRIAQAQLVGWLEGLFHGIQATLVAQQVAAQVSLQQMNRELPPTAGEQPSNTGYL